MPLLTLRNIILSHGHPPLFDGIDLTIEPGERLCLVGRNGAGKSTLFKLLMGEITADDGEVWRDPGSRIAWLEQEVPQGTSGSVFHVVAEGLGKAGQLVERYHTLTHAIADGDLSRMDELEACQQALEAVDGWEITQRVETVLTRLDLPADVDIATLSGGLKRRVLLARALVSAPDLLLLDEPTNHLDIEAITWLESFLLEWRGTLLFITHDRAFLQRLATRIIELDRGRLSDYPCDYKSYLERKEAQLAAEERQEALFDRKLAEEERWIRQGIKARRTRNEGRVRALKAMREERSQRRVRVGQAKMAIQEAERSGKIVAVAEGVDFAYDGRHVIHQLNATILRGDKVGIIGPNGAGKTTLLRLLLGDLQPTGGQLKLGTHIEVAYFDQYRAALDPQRSVQDNVSGGRDMLTINGKPRHAISYLQDFLFTPERARQPAGSLSGGERNRLLLAMLFTKPANVLVLDEPTNDLDADTLDLLEELLIDYQGTVLLVSHDRAFLDNVVSSTLVFEGDGVVNEYVGGYQDWLRQRRSPGNATPPAATPAKPAVAPTPATQPEVKKAKRSYKEQRELDALPQRIETLDAEISELHQAMADPDFFRDAERAATAQQRLEALEAEQAACFERWEALEARD